MSKKPPQPQLLVFAKVDVFFRDGTSYTFENVTFEPQTQGDSIAYVITKRSGDDSGTMFVIPAAPSTEVKFAKLTPSRLVAN